MTKQDDAKARFLKAADELFFESGYDNVGVADICRRCGKAKGLFFYYFDKKENVVKVLAERQVKQTSEALRDRMAQMDASGTDKLAFLMNALISRDSAGPRAFSYFKEQPLPEWFDSFAHGLKDTYIFPVILGIVRQIAQEDGSDPVPEPMSEIVYLGISAFMHRNHEKMADEAYYNSAADAISQTLERILKCAPGAIRIGSRGDRL